MHKLTSMFYDKKIYLLIGAIILLVVFAVTAFVLAVKKSNYGKEIEDEPLVEILKITNEDAISPIPSFDGNAIWFFTKKGKLFRVNLDGTSLTEVALPALSGEAVAAQWPMQGSDFILTMDQEWEMSRYYYNNQSKKFTFWPKNIQNFEWMPDSKRVAYVWKSTDGTSQQLTIADADTTGFRVVVNNLFWPDYKVLLAPNGMDALLIRSLADEVNKIYKVELDTGKFETVVEEGKNLDALWLPNSQKFIFTRASGSVYPRLYIYDFNSRKTTDLGFNSSLEKLSIDKDGKYLYVATPRKENSGEEFVKLDLGSLKAETFIVPPSTIQAKNVIYIGGKIFYVNVLDGNLYSIFNK